MGLTAGPGCMWEHPPPPQLPNGPQGIAIIYCYSGDSFNYHTSEPAILAALDWIPVAPVSHHSNGHGARRRVHWTCTGGNAEAIFRRGPLCGVLMGGRNGLESATAKRCRHGSICGRQFSGRLYQAYAFLWVHRTALCDSCVVSPHFILEANARLQEVADPSSLRPSGLLQEHWAEPGTCCTAQLGCHITQIVSTTYRYFRYLYLTGLFFFLHSFLLLLPTFLPKYLYSLILGVREKNSSLM